MEECKWEIKYCDLDLLYVIGGYIFNKYYIRLKLLSIEFILFFKDKKL